MPSDDDSGVDATADTLHSEDGTSAVPETSDTPRRTGPRAVRAGDVLGRYELVEEIGEGGMATVYRARDKELRRDVALKVLFPHLARRAEIVRRFQREARAAAGLQHDNILRIYDVGGVEDEAVHPDADPPYIVMELIRGNTLLAEIEQRGPVLAEIVACIGALLADALAIAHAAGIVHRDIKPANILVAPGGRLLLADFGVARLETEDSSLVTKTGALLGTPAYMSPEQASGETATAQSDLYSLGATLYQLATGVLPYSGSPAKVLAQIVSGTLVSPNRKRSSVGPDLSRAIELLMATEASGRPATAKVVAAELRTLASGGGMADPAAELAAYFADPEAYLKERTPIVVSAIVASARTAMAEARLPRAMALADRASALAPDDETVTALISTVTEGGRASRRKRVVLLGGLAVIVVGGAVATGLALRGGATAVPDAAMVMIRIDAAPVALDAAPIDAAVALPLDAIAAATVPDAGPRHPKPIDAATPIDAAELPIDALVIPIPIDAPVATPADGEIIVQNDVWCDIRIDDQQHGRLRGKPIRVHPGHHLVTCQQASTNRQWTREVDVAPGETKTVSGAMQQVITITIGTASEAQIGAVHYRPGQQARLMAGRYEVTVPNVAKKFVDFRTPCTLRESPELDCYP